MNSVSLCFTVVISFQCGTTDVCVPISKLTEMVVKTQEDIKESNILGEFNLKIHSVNI